MDQQLEQIKNVMKEQLAALDTMEPGLSRLTEALKIIDSAISRINEVRDHLTFKNREEEIYFFKYYQPETLACRVEEVMRYQIALHVPIGTDEARIRYYEEEIEARKSYFRMNNFHYQYYKTEMTDLDQSFFTMDAAPLSVPAADVFGSGNQYATQVTCLFAKFIAYERLQHHLLHQIALIKNPELRQAGGSSGTSDLRWTGDAVNIVELAYGLWLTGQLNNGNASLNQIVKWLENSLQVTIGIIQRRFNEIERRKRLSFTRYIDQMKDAILRKIDKGNS